MNWEKMQTACKTAHDKGRHGMRWGYCSRATNFPRPEEGGCFYAARPEMFPAKEVSSVYVVFHGDGLDIPFEGLVNPTVLTKHQMDYTRPWNKFEGTERSLLWVKYLLSANSPWKALHPFLAGKAPSVINDSGFIFEREGLPLKLFYNFLTAIRFPWEQPLAYSTFLAIRERVENDNAAVFISNMFYLAEGATSIEGPWLCQYPLSFLESLTLEAAGHFLSAHPRTLGDTGVSSPCCGPLWATGDEPLKEKLRAQTMSLAEREDLTLSEILKTVADVWEETKNSKEWGL